MELDIAVTTDQEIQDIIEKFKLNGYKQEDEAYVTTKAPFVTCDGCRNENHVGLVLYPELLTYYNDKTKGWSRTPWICIKTELQEFIDDEEKHRELAKWLIEEVKKTGLKPFKDEDAFMGHFTKVKNKYDVTFKMYVNPSFPEGYWSNHTL